MYIVTSKVNHFIQLAAGAVLGPGDTMRVEALTPILESLAARGRIEIVEASKVKAKVAVAPPAPPKPAVIKAEPKPAPVETVLPERKAGEKNPFEVTTREVEESMKDPPQPVDVGEPPAAEAQASEQEAAPSDDVEGSEPTPLPRTEPDDDEDDLGPRLVPSPQAKPKGKRGGRR